MKFEFGVSKNAFLVSASAFFVSASAFGQSITATKAYVDRRYTEATNAVPSIVTNEVAGWSEWRIVKGWEGFRLGHVRWVEEPLAVHGGYWGIEVVRDEDGVSVVDSLTDMPETACRLEPYDGTFVIERTRIVRNALGLAMVKDLEKLPTHETVTNVARDVSNSFWDEENQVLWRMEFRGGEPMFVPVTNENVKATGGVL